MAKNPMLGKQVRKVHPRLRMYANGNSEVNGVRSNYSSSIILSSQHAAVQPQTKIEPIDLESLSAKLASGAKLKMKRKQMAKPPDDVEVSVFVHFNEKQGVGSHEQEACVTAHKAKAAGSKDNITIARIPLGELECLTGDENVSFVEAGEPLKKPTPIVNRDGENGIPAKSLREFDQTGGEDVLIGIVDVEGFDFAHEDFLDNGKTRFFRIWDQGGDTHKAPDEFSYGAEITEEHMNNALENSTKAGLPPQMLERQSQMVPGSHATHVASIAAGNRGVCRKASIVGVLIDLPKDDLDRRKSLYDSTRIAHAVDYILSVADQLKQERGVEKIPVSINISLGTNGHAHDGSSALSRWIDSTLAVPGRSVCVAAGNAGQEAPEHPNDIGFISGRIHTSGQIEARGLNVDLDWQVVGNTIVDVSENELEIWYGPADRFSISIRPPGEDWIGPIAPGEFIENRSLANGTVLSVYNELYHAVNGSNYIAVYLTPFLSEQQVIGVQSGLWTIRLTGSEVRDGRFHAWIERDDPFQFDPTGAVGFWRFPSFFTQETNVDNTSVSSLACARYVVTVANLDPSQEKINVSSSQGPTRDGRNKPEVAAPGTDIMAANGFNFANDQPWIGMTGTSMASPYVAGVVGLMLQHEPSLSAAQIQGILQRTAQPLPGMNFQWSDDAGYGVINPKECIKEVNQVQRRRDRT